MSNPNFVSDLVAMAKAFEELPQVQEKLRHTEQANGELSETIQRLELRLIDLKTELDVAHAATRKVEVERDHAERMFLETDDRLNAFRRLLGSFQTEAGALIAAAEPEPAKPEDVQAVIEEVKVGASEVEHAVDVNEPQPPQWDEPQGERAVDPMTPVTSTEAIPASADTASTTSEPVHSNSVEPTVEAVSVRPDPTQVTESSSENVSSGSVQPESVSAEEVAPSVVDPIASSTAGDGHSPENVGTQAKSANVNADASTQEQPATSPVDDVGYHNEPKIATSGGAEAWAEWDKWCERMNRRYPHSLGGWPQRQQAAQ